MTLKVVPIQSKMPKPTLKEMVERLSKLFNSYTLRNEDEFTVVLTTLSYCIWKIQKITNNDEEVYHFVNEILDQYVQVDKNKSTFHNYHLFETLTPKLGPDDD
tara:strand:+ start:2172 stop:2480 length:309 start_codon:yes stop_codon:yes gene_type:complete